jgi:hypothetical protein
MRYQDGGRYSVEVKIERSERAAAPLYHGGDAEGVGCGVCFGPNGSVALLLSVGGVGLRGTLSGLIGLGDGGVGNRMMGIFVEDGIAGATLILTSVYVGGVRELIKKRMKSAVTGMTIKSTIAMMPSRVKRM